MVYSKTSEYAIRSLIYFAEYPEETRVTVKAVSRETGVPQAYVAKIFQCLARDGVLLAQRGPSGGYALSIPPHKLTLLRVVQTLDDFSQSSFSNCVMGLEKCNDRNPCPLHDIWVAAKNRMLDRLASTTISDIAKLGRKFRPGKHRRLRLSGAMRDIFTL
jgi:Rrf2 family protein